MPEYPSLEGFPAECAQSSWLYDVMVANMPYGVVDENAVEQRPLTEEPVLVELWQRSLTDDLEPGAIGWATQAEAAWNDLVSGYRRTVDHYAMYPDAWEPSAKELADAIENLQEQIAEIYRYFAEDVVIPFKTIGDRDPLPARPIPLSEDEADVAAIVDRDQVGIFEAARREARRQIRDAFLEANQLAWCGLYAIASAESYRLNKKLWEERYGPTGMGIAAEPQPRPPDPGPLFPDLTKEPPPPIEPPTPEPEPEPGMIAFETAWPTDEDGIPLAQDGACPDGWELDPDNPGKCRPLTDGAPVDDWPTDDEGIPIPSDTGECPPGWVYDPFTMTCQLEGLEDPAECPPLYKWDAEAGECVPDLPIPCPEGFVRNEAGECVPEERREVGAGAFVAGGIGLAMLLLLLRR